jgi:hypothetical protein
VDEDEERSPTELLPELKELSYFTIDHARDPFASFIFARQNAGRPVTLVRHRTRNILRDGIWTAFVPSD